MDNLNSYKNELIDAINHLNIDTINSAAELIIKTVLNGKNIYIAGNGGSASTAQHMLCDLVKTSRLGHIGRFTCLTDNTAIITAIGNDISYDDIFSFQLRNGEEGDLLILISGSGRSTNILNAIYTAKNHNMKILALLGYDGGDAKYILREHFMITIPSWNYGVIEDMHMIISHMITNSIRTYLEHGQIEPLHH